MYSEICTYAPIYDYYSMLGQITIWLVLSKLTKSSRIIIKRIKIELLMRIKHGILTSLYTSFRVMPYRYVMVDN